jgi:hypothetical protein
MGLNPRFWFIIHRYSVFHTFIWSGWVGGLSQMKLTSFEKTVTFCDDPLVKTIVKSAKYLVDNMPSLWNTILHLFKELLEVMLGYSLALCSYS